MNSRHIPTRIVKELYAKSGNCCAFSGCNEQLFEDANVGQICHIQGVNSGSARYNPDLPEEVVNGIDNLILLCSNHHRLIDEREDLFPVEKLVEMKKTHENFVSQSIFQSNRKMFFDNLQRIFQKNNFDRIILEQGYEAPFEDSIFENTDNGYWQICNLLNTDCALGLSGEERKEIYIFAEALNYVMHGIAENSYSNGNGIAIPNYKENDLYVIREGLKNLHREYVRYRFDSGRTSFSNKKM